jgi:hypothetical protein
VFNAQQQPRIVWPASSAVARAYVDQLTRSNGIQPERAREVTAALQRADRRAGDRNTLEQLDALATQLERDADAATPRDAARLRALAANIKTRAAGSR